MSFLRLVGTEVRRFELRRAMRWMVGLGLLLIVIVNVVQIARSERTAGFREAFVFGSVPAECRTGATHNGRAVIIRDCPVDRAEGGGFDAGGPAEGEVVYVRVINDRRVQVGRNLEETIRGLGIGLTMLGVLLGSTFLAAEFGASGLSTQLVFEPRRLRLYLAKTVAVFLGGLGSAAILIVGNALLQFGASAVRGSTAGVDAGWFGERAADVFRASATCGLAAVCALAVGSITRRTVVAVGVFFGLTIGTGFLGGVSWGEPLARVSPMNTLFATGFGDLHDPEAFFGLKSLTGAVTISLVWVVVLSLLGAFWFDRREIR